MLKQKLKITDSNQDFLQQEIITQPVQNNNKKKIKLWWQPNTPHIYTSSNCLKNLNKIQQKKQ